MRTKAIYIRRKNSPYGEGKDPEHCCASKLAVQPLLMRDCLLDQFCLYDSKSRIVSYRLRRKLSPFPRLLSISLLCGCRHPILRVPSGGIFSSISLGARRVNLVLTAWLQGNDYLAVSIPGLRLLATDYRKHENFEGQRWTGIVYIVGQDCQGELRGFEELSANLKGRIGEYQEN